MVAEKCPRRLFTKNTGLRKVVKATYGGWRLPNAGRLRGVVSRKVKLRIEAPVNGGRNYNGPKVDLAAALVKLGYMLESLSIPHYSPQKAVTICWVQIISRKC